MKKVAYLAHVLVVALGLSLVACGGGGGGGGGPSGGAPGGSTGGAGSGGAAGGGAGGGSGGSSSGGGTAVGTARLGPNLGQALLGPIVGAIVRVYEAENFNGIVVCTVTTSFAGAPQGPGVIDLSTCPISVSSVYFLVVSGGMDIDANDDKIIDAAPTAKTGSLRAIISGRSIRDGNFRVNIVTELAYQGVADTLFSGAGDAEILARVDGLARQLLSSDLNGDGIVDNEDLVDFSPVEDGGFVADAYEDLLSEIRSVAPSLARRVVLLEDCMSAVTVPDPLRPGEFLADYTTEAAVALDRFAAAGVKIGRSTDSVLDWLDED